jgi:hypothetical protein
MGLMILPSGFKYEGLFENDKPCGKKKTRTKKKNEENKICGITNKTTTTKKKKTDRERCLHPDLKEAIRNKICTGSVTRANHQFGQFIYTCRTCGDLKEVCDVCKDLCHPYPSHEWTEYWSWGSYNCTCYKGEQSCMAIAKVVQPQKRPRIEIYQMGMDLYSSD